MNQIDYKGDSSSFFLNPIRIILHLWLYRDIIRPMVWRDISGRYRGSLLGFGWSFLQPLLMLCVYTFVFSFV